MSIEFGIAETPEDLEEIYKIREKVFQEEDGYPPEAIKSRFDSTATHFLAKVNKKLVGSIMVILDSDKGLPLGDKIDLSPYRDKLIAELAKLAVLPEERKKNVSLGLMVLAYEFAKEKGAKKICLISLEKKTENYKLYKKFGFKTIGKFNFFNIDNAYGMILDLDESIYEKVSKRNTRRDLLAKRLSQKLSLILGE
jgi:predicted N-acetyltransferase YhbS